MLEIRVSGGDGERRALEIDVDAVEAVVSHDAGHRGDEVRNALRNGEGEVLAATAERNHDLPAVALQPGDVGLELFGIQSGGCVELHGPFGRILVGRGEGDEDEVPLRRDLAKGDGGTRAAV